MACCLWLTFHLLLGSIDYAKLFDFHLLFDVVATIISARLSIPNANHSVSSLFYS